MVHCTCNKRSWAAISSKAHNLQQEQPWLMQGCESWIKKLCWVGGDVVWQGDEGQVQVSPTKS